MKILIIIAFLLSCTGVLGQPVKNKPRKAVPKTVVAEKKVLKPAGDRVYDKVEIAPSFKGNFKAFLEQHLRIPAEAAESGQVGTVVLKFIVNTDGSVSAIQIDERSPAKYPALVNAFTRLIQKTSGQWNPGTLQGRPVRCWHLQHIFICPAEE